MPAEDMLAWSSTRIPRLTCTVPDMVSPVRVRIVRSSSRTNTGSAGSPPLPMTVPPSPTTEISCVAQSDPKVCSARAS